jgi:uncharacterized tellurite resistance protein B-like protein
MFDSIKSWLMRGGPADKASRKGRQNFQEYEIAAAALLVEAASLDGQFDATERRTILRLLEHRFGLTSEETAGLLAEAQTRHDATDELFKFALAAREAFDEEERIELVEMLWTTVLSDGRVHDYEANLMRRIAGLLHVPDREAGEARKRAAESLASKGGNRGDKA